MIKAGLSHTNLRTRSVALLAFGALLANTTACLAEDSVRSIAGEYQCGGGNYGTTLSIKRDGTFEFEAYFDVGNAKKPRNHGKCDLKGDYLQLSPADPIEGDTWSRLDTKYTVVRWSKRVYLVPGGDQGIIDFCNQINAGYEPRKNSFGWPYVRTGKSLDLPSVKGLPSLSAQWGKYVLAHPIECRVTGLKKTDRTGKSELTGEDFGLIYQATFDKGLLAGLRHGMVLQVTNSEAFNKKYSSAVEEVRLVKVTDETCVGELTIGVKDEPFGPGASATTRSRYAPSDKGTGTRR